MIVYKFGGASVKNAKAVQNVLTLLRSAADQPTTVVISALDKTTNKLEEVHRCWRQGKDYTSPLAEIEAQHRAISEELDLVWQDGGWWGAFQTLRLYLQQTPEGPFDQTYDTVVGTGEMLSTLLISAYLKQQQMDYLWLDAKELISTDDRHRDARINWNQTQQNCQRLIPADGQVITQGYIGKSAQGHPTTLGREGSDYTGAVLAYCLEAQKLVIWKDVPGMLSADPKKVPDATFIPQLTYKEALELAYYGASVIHPKTVQPLEKKNIPLHIQSFLNPHLPGTIIGESATEHYPPCIIIKENQILVSLQSTDGNFVVEDNIEEIFRTLHQLGITVHMTENSALSFTFCTSCEEEKIHQLREGLRVRYRVTYNSGLTLDRKSVV